jgi:WhiB family redox-sensing transcriptional regulator
VFNFLKKEEWEHYALCYGMDQSLFFPENSPGRDARIYSAKQVCARCPVKRECLDTALDDPKLVGIWGGRTEQERKDMRRVKAALDFAESISVSVEVHSNTQHHLSVSETHIYDSHDTPILPVPTDPLSNQSPQQNL